MVSVVAGDPLRDRIPELNVHDRIAAQAVASAALLLDEGGPMVGSGKALAALDTV
jgi:hypothetical protein